MSELVRRSATPRETIHHYLRLGLLSRPAKSSKNMARYDERHLDELRLIAKLRDESYLPLDRIKLILDEGRAAAAAREIDLVGELFGRSAKVASAPIDRAELMRRSGLPEEMLDAAQEAGVLGAEPFGWEELRVAERVAEARVEGLDEALIERLAILERHVHAMVDDELAHFFGMIAAGVDPERGLGLLASGRETIARYLAVSRARRMRAAIEAVLSEVERLAERPYVPAPPSSQAERERWGEPAVRARLAADPRALLEHLLLQGDYEEVMARARPGVEDAPAYIEAAVEAARYAEARERLSSYRAAVPRAARPPRVEAAYAAATLAGVRDRLAVEERSPWARLQRLQGDVLRELMSAFSVLAGVATRVEAEPDPLERARSWALIGRVYALTPRFLGLHAVAAETLARARAELGALAGSAEDPGLGVLARLEGIVERAEGLLRA